jgi:hypothetical protein
MRNGTVSSSEVVRRGFDMHKTLQNKAFQSSLLSSELVVRSSEARGLSSLLSLPHYER